MEMTDQALPLVDVHNAWTIYGLNADGSQAREPLAMHGRPEDWGDPQRWSYHQFAFEWIHAGIHYRNNLHGWTDLKRQPHEYPQLFASLVVMILQPGTDPRICGRAYLKDEDEWDDDWGPMPPVLEEYDDDPGEDIGWTEHPEETPDPTSIDIS